MSFMCNQCFKIFSSHGELDTHLMSEHGLNRNPVPISLLNLAFEVAGLIKRVDELEDYVEKNLDAIDSRLEDLEEPDE